MWRVESAWWSGRHCSADQGRTQIASPSIGHMQSEVAGPEGLDTPVLVVEQMVVIPTQENQIVRLRFAAIEPVLGVVGITASCRYPTAGPAASVISDHEEVELNVTHDSALAAEVDDVADRI
jgi:hypothetical protein